MDFGRILERWEHDRLGGPVFSPKAGIKDARNINDFLSSWLDTHPVQNKDADTPEASRRESGRRKILRSKAPDASLDLHGKTREEAWRALDDFFRAAQARNLEKVLLIHGKGNHSKDGAILKEFCRVYIEQCEFAGESGYPPASDGGSGATWVLLKQSR
ncbi:MAG: Smr/MutS family protein [Spirochaetaceae bacterium]|jgi:DNA-nicking Smr family endonuclease|nr:Smr/MutS family protein [Spirochaetaceae bacterium]